MGKTLYCPQCAQADFSSQDQHRYLCSACHFEFFFNAAATASAIIFHDQHMLVAIRGREPEKGRFDVPGGFVDPGENLEQAAAREISEELGIALESLEYFASGATRYRYGHVDYRTCDAFFLGYAANYEGITAGDDVAAVRWVPLSELREDMFAFDNGGIVMDAVKAHVTHE